MSRKRDNRGDRRKRRTQAQGAMDRARAESLRRAKAETVELPAIEGDDGRRPSNEGRR
jgi:hypothetical protein